MQTSKPNRPRSTSPQDGLSKSPFKSSAAAVAGQLNSLSLGGSSWSVKGAATQSHGFRKKSKSVSSSTHSVPLAGSPIKTSTGHSSSKHGHGGSRSAKTSPVKTVRSGHSKTPSRAAASLSKSLGASAGASVVAAGGLGRMDIVAKDWEAVSSASSGSSPQKKRPATKNYDRFIPARENSGNNAGALDDSANRKADDTFEEENSNTSEADAAGVDAWDDSPARMPNGPDNTDHAHTAELSKNLGIELGRRILSFSAEPPAASNEHSSLLAAYARGDGGPGRSGGHQSALAASQRRRIATTPERVLDAPGLVDDYYLNLLDWSATNLVAIALSESVYIWNAESGDVGCLCSVAGSDDTAEDIVCSVKFSDDGSYLAVGTSSGPVQIYDLSTSTRVRTMAGHATRVPSLSWSGAILSSGSRDGSIWNSDVRVAQHKVGEMRGHRAEVCGLAWRKDSGLAASASASSGGGHGLLASGGNDNVVNVWDGRMLSAPKMVKTNHTAAVKALAWCPWQSSLLATGGGSSDRTIHFWNTTTSARLSSLVTPSQVTSLVFNPHSREILSSHGFPDNQLSLWTFPTLTKVIDITRAHETRVLHSCLSPDGTTIATASNDENLKFWKVFDLPKKSASSSAGGMFAGKVEPKTGDEVGRRGRSGIAIR